MHYTLVIIHPGPNQYVNVCNESGYLNSFYGPTCKQDAIYFIKRVGGKSATFLFEDYK